MPRRPNPKPSPYVAKDGTRTWRIRYRLGTGPTAVNTSETFDTKRDAQDFAADIRDFGTHEAVRRLTERDTPTAAAPPCGPTLDGILDDFLDWKAPRVRSTRTVEEYRSRYRSIGPTLGGIPLCDLTDAHVQSWVDGMVAGTISPRKVGTGPTQTLEPLAPKSIADRHGLLHSLIRYATRPPRSLITHDPCAGTELPPRHKRPPKYLNLPEWQALHAALTQIDPDAADFALVMYCSGMRIQEATALSPASVIDEGGPTVTLIVSEVLRREAHGVSVIVPDTKSDSGFREVEVDPDCTAMIRRRRAAVGHRPLLFTNARGSMWRYGKFRERAWDPAVKAANLTRKPTPHWLRHTHVVDMLNSGATMEQVRARVGHVSIGTTMNVYGRFGYRVDADVLTRFAQRRTGGKRALLPGPVIPGEIV